MKAKHAADIGKMMVAGHVSGDDDALYQIIKGKYDTPIMIPGDEEATYYFGVHPKRCCSNTPNEEVRQYKSVPENMKQHELFLREVTDTLSFIDDIIPIIDTLAQDSNVVKEANRRACKTEALIAVKDDEITRLVKEITVVKDQNDAMEEALGMQEGGWKELQREKEANEALKRMLATVQQQNADLQRKYTELREKEEARYIAYRQQAAEQSISQDEKLLELQKENTKMKTKMDEKVAKGIQKAMEAQKKKKKAAAKKIKLAMAAADSDSDSDSDSD